MLRVAGHAGLADPGKSSGGQRDFDCLAHAGEAGAAKACLDAWSSSLMRAFRRVVPLRDGDQVDLPSIQPLRDDRGVDAAPKVCDGGGSRRVESSVLFVGRSRRATSRRSSASAS